MNFLDVLIAIPLIIAAVMGYKEGVVVQLGGIVGVIIGIWFAYKFGAEIGGVFGMSGTFGHIIGFIIVLILTIVALSIAGHALKGVFKFAGLGVFDTLGGAVLSVLKVGLVLGIVLCLYQPLNDRKGWIKPSTFANSLLYEPVVSISAFTFPYIKFFGEQVK